MLFAVLPSAPTLQTGYTLLVPLIDGKVLRACNIIIAHARISQDFFTVRC